MKSSYWALLFTPLVLCGCFALFELGLVFHTAAEQTEAVGNTLSSAVNRLAGNVDAQLTAARSDLAGQIRGFRRDIVHESSAYRGALLVGMQLANARAEQSIGMVDARLAGFQGVFDGLSRDAKPVLTNAAALTQDAKDSLDDVYWELKASVNSATVAATSVAQMSEEAKLYFPKFEATWDGIGGNVEAITGNVNRLTKPHWYDRVIGYGLNGAILYRNLNPVTNLSIKGAQLVSGRP